MPRTTSEIAERETPYVAASATWVGRSGRTHACRMAQTFGAFSFADAGCRRRFVLGAVVVMWYGFVQSRDPHSL